MGYLDVIKHRVQDSKFTYCFGKEFCVIFTSTKSREASKTVDLLLTYSVWLTVLDPEQLLYVRKLQQVIRVFFVYNDNGKAYRDKGLSDVALPNKIIEHLRWYITEPHGGSIRRDLTTSTSGSEPSNSSTAILNIPLA